MSNTVIIIGAGQAGVQAAESLRSGGFAGRVLMLGDEPEPPYHRPPLSKAWLAGELQPAQLVMRAPEALARKNIELRLDVRVDRIEREGRELVLADGERIGYDGLVIATGATANPLRVPGGDAAGVLALRSKAHANLIAEAFAECVALARPVVVVGGGFIGLEVAATARKRGLAVTVLEAAPRLMARAVAPFVSDWYRALHERNGVRIVLQAGIDAIEHTPAGGLLVQLSDGSSLPAGVVVCGVGVRPADSLAHAAGIACDRGVIVDEYARTSDPVIYAAGDCTARRLPDASLLRLESVQNAVEQGRSAAAGLLGTPRPFVAAPWFWSDQFDVKLQMAGLSAGADTWVLRGDAATPPFSVFHFRGDRLLAVDSMNAAKDHMVARRLLDAGVSPTPAQAADPAFDLAALLKT